MDMRTSSFRVAGALAMFGLLAGGVGCAGRGTGGGGRPSTPPTFVLAWTGPSGDVSTLESRNGNTWLNELTHAGTSAVNGPGIGHDGNLTWLLVWPTPVGAPPATTTGLALKVGVGGVPAGGPPGGVVWETTVSRGPAVNPVAGRPSVAFGDDRWYIAYRTMGGGIEVVRSLPNSVTAWGPPTSVMLPSGGLFSSADPDLAHGNGVLVLAFVQGLTIAATRSTDGMSWTAPSTIGASEAFGPGLTFHDGVFLATPTHLFTSGMFSTLRFRVFRSTDGVSWRGSLGEGGNWDQSLNVPATAAYGNGRLLLARRGSTVSSEVEVWVGQANSMANPTSITFPPPPRGSSTGARSSPFGVSVAFGSSNP